MKIGGKYNWKGQPERLVYLGCNWSGNGYWHQFAKADGFSSAVWCEVLDADLHMIEETTEATKPQEPVVWNDGYPTNPWDSEWFIAKTKYGDKVVLRKLPDEYTYDFTTADGTYMKKENITKWMQFPESEFIAPHPVSDMDILDIVLKIGKEMGLEDDGANFEFAQRVIAEATPQPCLKCREWEKQIPDGGNHTAICGNLRT